MCPSHSEPGGLSQSIVTSVAEWKGVKSLALPPLTDTIDPDALDALVAPSDDQSRPMVLTFTYADTKVTVTAGETVEVSVSDPLSGDSRAADVPAQEVADVPTETESDP